VQLDPSCADTRGGRRDSAHLAPNPIAFRIRIAARVNRRMNVAVTSHITPLFVLRKCADSILAK